MKKHSDTWTLREHAEAWTKEQGREVPLRDSKEYEIMYQKWVDYAFKDFSDVD